MTKFHILIKRRFIYLFVFIFGTASSYSFGQDAVTINLTAGDSNVFERILWGFGGPKNEVDPNDANSILSKRWYSDDNGSVEFICVNRKTSGLNMGTLCQLIFDESKSSPEVEVKPAKIPGAVIATIRLPNDAKHFFDNLRNMTYTSMEKISIELDDGRRFDVPRLRVDCQKNQATQILESCSFAGMYSQTLLSE